MSTIVSSAPPSTSTATGGGSMNSQPAGSGGGGGGGPTSSPLLFFVALGFGVVFTNLWIIVGVKYCFRYNRRRAAAAAGENGEPIDMTAMPRPHRRRREKKLMTMDEVNEQFPLMKYKQWKSSRETEGLPANGGIATAPQSRAASVKDVEGTIPARADATSPQAGSALSMARDDVRNPASPRASMSPAEAKETGPASKKPEDEKTPMTRTDTVDTTGKETNATHARHDDDDESEDEDDPIRTATAPEMLAEPGDTCAICLDTLEDDDDVRGLTCGHAFHASCVDPWLTSRRACCPLCKADYYVPKPRPEGEAADQNGSGRRPGMGRSPTSPQAIWTSPRNGLFRSRVVIIGNQNNASTQRADRFGRLSRPSRQTPAATGDATQQPQNTESTGWMSRLRPNRTQGSAPHSSWFGRNRNETQPATTAATEPTPSQLEAGNR